VQNLSIAMIANRLQESGLLEIILPGTHSTVFTNIYRHYCENKYTKSLSEGEQRYEVRTSQELMLKIRIFFMNSTTHKRRHTYSSLRTENYPSDSCLVTGSTRTPTESEGLVPDRNSESSLTTFARMSGGLVRVSDPLFNYYHTSSFRRLPSSSYSYSSSSNKTKKNRRAI
jgi:hypothetical protein